jgi:hypothetical protein
MTSQQNVNPLEPALLPDGTGRRTDAFLSLFGQGMGVLYRQGVQEPTIHGTARGASDDQDPERFSSVLLPSHVRVGGRPRSRHLAQLTARCVPCCALHAAPKCRASLFGAKV